MAHCNLCGTLPDWLSKLDQLQKLVLFDNNLEGERCFVCHQNRGRTVNDV